MSTFSLRDCVRLGKFNSSNTRPRPLLVKLTRIPDVDSVLYNRSNITEGILVKPDMSRDERHKESILLKERWSLTQSGVDKKHIKIRGTKLFIKDRLHGQIINSVFVAKSETDVPNLPNNNSSLQLRANTPSNSN